MWSEVLSSETLMSIAERSLSMSCGRAGASRDAHGWRSPSRLRTSLGFQSLKSCAKVVWNSGRPQYFGEPIHYRYTGRWSKPETGDEFGRSARVPLIVPPLADKLGYFENEDIRFMWQ